MKADTFLPPLRWLREYSVTALTQDMIAGLILSILLIPQAMAYATLAGLPPKAGLYSAILPPLVYACLGTSRSASLGPVALASLLVADAIGGSALPPAMAAEIIALEVGALLICLGLLRLGRLVNFISDPVLLGFTAAAAILIAASQLPPLLGIEAKRGGTIIETMAEIGPMIGDTSLTTLAVGLGALLLLIASDRLGGPLLWKLGLHPPLRGALVKSAPFLVLILSSTLVSALSLDVATVAKPPSGLPPVTPPPLMLDAWLSLLPSSIIIAIIIFVTGMAIAKPLAGRQRQSLNTSQEAIAIGAANVASALTGGYTPGVSFSRSALVTESGAQSPLASAFGAVVVLLAALFLAGALAYLPQAALAALVISAVFGLIRVNDIFATWRHSRTEGGVIAITLIVTLLFGVQWGLAAGALTGIAAFLWFSSLPRVTRLGERTQDDGHYRSVDRENIKIDSMPVLAIRFDRSLYFGNVGHCEDQLLTLLSLHPDARCLLIDMKGVNDIDASGIAMLKRLVDDVEEKRLTVGFAELREPLQRKFLLSYELRHCELYSNVAEGVRRMREDCGE